MHRIIYYDRKISHAYCVLVNIAIEFSLTKKYRFCDTVAKKTLSYEFILVLEGEDETCTDSTFEYTVKNKTNLNQIKEVEWKKKTLALVHLSRSLIIAYVSLRIQQ